MSDSLLILLKSEKNWEEKARLTYDYTRITWGQDFELLNELHSDILDHHDAITDPRVRFNTFNILGVIHQFKAEYDTSTVLLQQAKELAETIPDSSLMLKAVGNLGINYRNTGQYAKAIENQQIVLEYYTSKKDSIQIARALVEIANAHCYLENFQQAKKHAFSAFDLVENISRASNVRASIHESLSYVYLKQDELDSALFQAEESSEFYHRSGNKIGHANAQRTLCDIRKKLGGSAEEELDCLLQQLELDKEVNDQVNILYTLLNLNMGFSRIGQYDEGVPFLHKAMDMARQRNDSLMIFEAWHSYAIYFKNKKQFKRAYTYLDSAFNLERKIRGVEVQKTIQELEQKYALAKTESELLSEQVKSQQLAVEKGQALLALSRKNKWIFGLVALAIVIILVAMLLTLHNKKKAQEEKDLALLEERDRSMIASVEAQEEERKRISKDLHDGVGQQLSALKMQMQMLANKEEIRTGEIGAQVDQLVQLTSKSAEEVREISHQMMPRALRELGLKDALEDMLNHSLANSELNYEFEHYNVEGRYPENIEIGLFRICQELVNNVIKHASAENVSIQLIKNGSFLVLIVEDDGRGFSAENKGRGRGLLNIASRVRTVQGTVNFEPSNNSGTTATIRIKLDEN